MTKVINIFSKKPVEVSKQLTFLTAQVNKKKVKQNTSVKTTQADLEASADWNYREDWALTTLSAKTIGLDIVDIEENHLVHLHDMGRAIALAHILKQDQEAVEYFVNLMTQVTAAGLFYVNLGQLPDKFKGYVWASNFKVIINAGSYTEYQLWRIIDRPVTRKTFY